jgi:alkylation response protein AidB-like acyl-CoA dehydrogenase
MTIVEHGTTPERVLESARALAPAIAGRAAEVEAARRVPRDLLDQLIGAGCFEVSRPRSHGGVGADLPAAMRVVETLATADASVGWTVMIGGFAWVDLAGLPRATFDALFSGAPVIVAGAFNPAGSITPVDEGYRVTGRWGFVSGCEHADVLYGNSVEKIVDGAPRMRIAVFTPDQVEIEDTWTVSGLCGTGSHHMRATDVLVPAERTHSPLADEPCLDEPVVRIPIPALAALSIAAVAIGTAQGAIHDVVDLASHKVPLLAAGRLAASPHFQLELATADTELRAARALLYETAESLWSTAVTGDECTLAQRAEARAAAVWATARAAAVVDTAYRCGGGSAVYADSPLQRRLRDVHAVTQHFLVKQDTMITAGAVLAGQEVTVPVF